MFCNCNGNVHLLLQVTSENFHEWPSLVNFYLEVGPAIPIKYRELRNSIKLLSYELLETKSVDMQDSKDYSVSPPSLAIFKVLLVYVCQHHKQLTTF